MPFGEIDAVFVRLSHRLSIVQVCVKCTLVPFRSELKPLKRCAHPKAEALGLSRLKANICKSQVDTGFGENSEVSMQTVTSRDGTPIAFDRLGQGLVPIPFR